VTNQVDDETKAKDVQAVASYIREHGKLNAAGDSRQLTQSPFYDLMGDQFSLTKPVLQTVGYAYKTVANATVEVGTTDLAQRIEEAKEKGEDPKGLQSSVRISTPWGPLETDVFATHSVPNPSDGSRTERPGVIKFKVKTNSWIDAEAAEKARKTIGDLLA